MNDQDVKKLYYEKNAERLIKKLTARNFAADYAPDAAAAKKLVLGLIPAEGVVAIAGGQTLRQIGVCDELRQSGRQLVDPDMQKGLTPAEALKYRKGTLTADTLLAGANALDEDGRIYNIDGLGNRVAAMIFGPSKVILAVGLNKAAGGPEEAWRRARQIASPMNNMRLELPNPCCETGHCHDCAKDSRICNYFSVIERSNPKGRIHLVLIGGEFGY